MPQPNSLTRGWWDGLLTDPRDTMQNQWGPAAQQPIAPTTYEQFLNTPMQWSQEAPPPPYPGPPIPGSPGYVTSDGQAPGTGGNGAPSVAPPPAPPAPGTTGAGWSSEQKTGTAGRTGASYAAFLAANPGFDPWSNLDQYAGANAGNDPILAQAFGWTNQWARNNGFNDGSNIPLAQRQQVFLSNLERARQQFADYAVDGQPHPGAITWEQSQASRIPNQGWSYAAGSGLHGAPQPGAPPAAPSIVPPIAPTAAPVTNNGQGGNTVSGFTPGQIGLVNNTSKIAGQEVRNQGLQQTGMPGGVNAASLGANYTNPDAIWEAVLRASGHDPNLHTTLNDTLKQRLLPNLVSYIQAKISGGQGSSDDTAGLLGNVTSAMQGGGLASLFHDAGQGMMGGIQDAFGQDQATGEQALQRALGLSLYGRSALDQGTAAAGFQNAGERFKASGIYDPSGMGAQDTDMYSYMKDTPFWKMAQRLGMVP